MLNNTAQANVHTIERAHKAEPLATVGLPQHDEQMELRQYLSALTKRWPMILGFAFLATLLAVLLAFSIAPTYRATAVLLIESEQRKAVSIEQVIGIDSSKQEYYLTQFELLKSRSVAQKVIDKYHLSSLAEFNGEQDKSWLDKLKNPGATVRDYAGNSPLLLSWFPAKAEASLTEQEEARAHRVMAAFQERLSISPVRKTQLVKISFESHNPRLAADIANAVGEAYIESNRDARLQASREATTWLEDRLTKLKSAVTESEQRLTAFLEQEGLVDVSGIDSLASSELADLSRRLSDARDRRVAAESLYFVLQDNRSAGLANLSSISAISNHPQLRDVRMAEIEAERLVSELSKRYGPKHDKMVQAQAQLASVKERANMLLSGLASGIEKELGSARKQEAALASELDSKKAQFQGIAVKRTTYDALQREVESNRKLYDLFLNRQKETAATTDFQTAVARFSDRASVPLNAAKPRKGLLVFLVLVMSLILASFLSYFLEVFNNSIEKAQDVTEKLGLTPLGAIPQLKLKKSKKRPISSDVFFDDKFNRFSESIRTLRTSILLNMMNQESKTICITSSAPGEGKSTVSMNLAIAMASMEKVLLIEGDLRRPSLGERFSLAAAHPGISNHLVMNAELDDCIYIHQKSGLHVLSAGALIKSPQELLASEKFAAMFAQLSQSYDRIVIDSPPLLAVSDALILAKYADSALLVVGAGQARIKQLKDAIARLFNHQVPVEGVVVNKVSHKASSKSNDYGYYGYSS